MSTDRIEKTILLRAPRTDVWRAISTPREFGAWFGANLSGTFAPGARITGPITIPGYDHLTMDFVIERMDAGRLLSYRWHPYAVEPQTDYSNEPTTLVEFRLDDTPDGTRLTVIESGFDRLPAERRTTAFRMNEGGWTAQLTNIERYLARHGSALAPGKR
jgi:uncharacterized protein YndB with AHSA1/START domain